MLARWLHVCLLRAVYVCRTMKVTTPAQKDEFYFRLKVWFPLTLPLLALIRRRHSSFPPQVDAVGATDTYSRIGLTTESSDYCTSSCPLPAASGAAFFADPV